MSIFFFFFFNDTATTEIYTLSLHDALPISLSFTAEEAWRLLHPDDASIFCHTWVDLPPRSRDADALLDKWARIRSEEHTSELQSRQYLVCRLLLEKKKKK